MNITLDDRDDLLNRMRNGPQGEQFIGPDRQEIEGAEKQARLCAQYDGDGDATGQFSRLYQRLMTAPHAINFSPFFLVSARLDSSPSAPIGYALDDEEEGVKKGSASGFGRRKTACPTIGNNGLALVAQAVSPAAFDFFTSSDTDSSAPVIAAVSISGRRFASTLIEFSR